MAKSKSKSKSKSKGNERKMVTIRMGPRAIAAMDAAAKRAGVSREQYVRGMFEKAASRKSPRTTAKTGGSKARPADAAGSA